MSVYNPATDSPSMAVSTRDNLNRGEWFSELQAITRYPICEILMNDGLAKERTGKLLTWRAADDPGVPKPRTTLYSTYSADKHAKAYQANMPWRHGEETCAIDKRERTMNSGEAMVIDEVELELQHMYQRVCDSCETPALAAPPGPSDNLNEVGIPYYLNCPSNANGTFCGVVPAGYTAGTDLIAGIDPQTTHPRYRNYANLYTDFTPDNLGVIISNMFLAISFNPPPKGKDDGTSIDALRCYLGNETRTNLELMATAQNDRLGNDILPMFASSMMKGITPTPIPLLGGGANEPSAAAAVNSFPMFFVNHNLLYPVFLPGERFAEEGPLPIPMSKMIHWHISWSYNWECKSRRRQAVLAKAAPFGEGAFS